MAVIGNVSVLHKSTETIFTEAADTDAARGTALLAAVAAAVAGDTIVVRPGDFSLTAALVLLDNQTLELHGARLYNTTNANDLITVTGKTGWRVVGTGSLRGAGLGVGGVFTDQSGIRISGTDTSPANWQIDGIYCLDFKGCGIAVVQTTPGTSGGKVTRVTVTNSTYGLYNAASAEHLHVSESEFFTCTIGLYIAGGNFVGNGLSINACGTGVFLGPGGNNGHGQIVGSSILHSTTYTIRTNGVPIGFDFVGCHFTDTLIYLESSKGIHLLGGMMFGAAPAFYMAGSAAGYSWVRDLWFQGSTVPPTVGGLADQLPFLIFRDCALSTTNQYQTAYTTTS